MSFTNKTTMQNVRANSIVLAAMEIPLAVDTKITTLDKSQKEIVAARSKRRFSW